MKRTPKAAKVNWRKSCEDALNQVHALAKVVQERTEFGNRFHARALQADEALKTELLTTAVLREEVKNLSAKIVKMQAENYQQVLDYNKLWSESTEEIDSLRGQNETLENLLATQRALLIQYNTRGNLIHWFGEFLLAKEPRA
jgi:DNA repair exonuclease SbcCD ATPase subunit